MHNNKTLLTNKGFTLIEVAIVMALFAIMAGLIATNLIRPQAQASLNSTYPTIYADIKSQQVNAMAGSTRGETSSQDFGVYFDVNSYTIFTGTSYIPGESGNLTVELASGLEFSNITLPASQVVFTSNTGVFSGYIPAQDSVTLTHNTTNESLTFTINKYGGIDIQ